MAIIFHNFTADEGMDMRFSWLNLVAKIFLAIVAFLVQIAVGFPNNWFGSLRPAWQWGIVAAGIIATSTIIAWAEYERRTDVKGEVNSQVSRMETQLNLDKKEFADIFLSEVLKILVESLKIPGQARAAIYLKDSTGKLKVCFDHGMKDMPDYGLEYAPSCGWAWESWNTTEQTFCDLDTYGRKNIIKKWKFTRGQFSVMWSAGVRSVLMTPITAPSDADTPIGILGIDSTMPMAVSQLDKQLIMDEAYDRARKIGQLLVKAKLV